MLNNNTFNTTYVYSETFKEEIDPSGALREDAEHEIIWLLCNPFRKEIDGTLIIKVVVDTFYEDEWDHLIWEVDMPSLVGEIETHVRQWEQTHPFSAFDSTETMQEKAHRESRDLLLYTLHLLDASWVEAKQREMPFIPTDRRFLPDGPFFALTSRSEGNRDLPAFYAVMRDSNNVLFPTGLIPRPHAGPQHAEQSATRCNQLLQQILNGFEEIHYLCFLPDESDQQD